MTAGPRATVLVVDDDSSLRTLCTAALKRDYSVLTAKNGHEGLRLVYERRPDLVLLDVMMPGMNGFEVCARVREIADVPIIMLTARGADHDVARGLDAGAEDYVLKPFRPVELVARIRAALRRRRDARSADVSEQLSFHNGDLVVDTGRQLAVVRGKAINLSAIEYTLLELLARHAGQVLTHDQLLSGVWGYEYAGGTGYVKTYVGRLRDKLEAVPGRPRFIQSRRGLGYYLEPRAPQDAPERGARGDEGL